MKSRAPAAETQLDGELLRRHKALTLRIVMPLLSALSLLFFVTNLKPGPYLYPSVGFLFFVLVTNAVLTAKGAWRTERRDTIRWLANFLVLDPLLFLLYAPAARDVAFGGWLVLLLGAAFDTFGMRTRTLLLGVGLVSYVAIYHHLYPDTEAAAVLFSVAAMVGILVSLFKVERFWVAEMARTQTLRQREAETFRAAESMKAEAALGAYARIIMHELRNVTTVLELIADKSPGAVGRAAAHIKRLQGLVLLGKDSAEERVHDVGALLEDLEILMARYVRARGVAWSVEAGTEARTARFRERAGATYFIIHNFVKNACEAIVGPDGNGRGSIQVRALIQADGRTLELAVRDDGPGLEPALRAQVLEGTARSTKPGGHGLGLRFVKWECEHNGFALDVRSRPGATEFVVLVPTVR